MGDEIEGRLETVANRIEFIDLLAEEGPLRPRDIVDTLPHSRATVTRALRELREADIITKTDNGYRPTQAGLLAADQYHDYHTTSTAILEADTLLEAIPPRQTLPPTVLIDADPMHADRDVPVRVLEAISNRVRRADAITIYLPTLVNTHLLRVWHQTVTTDTVDSIAFFDPDLLTVLKGQYPHLLAGLAATDRFEAYETTGPPYGIVETTTGDQTTVTIIVYRDEATVAGVITNDTPAAREWATTQFETLRTDATPVTPALETLSDTTPTTASHTPRRTTDPIPPDESRFSLPLDLEAEGFVRLSAEYFDAHNRAPPAVSWRTGFTLTEVHDGHAVDRHDATGTNLTTHLRDTIQTGADHVVLGPPGSGKSTICMAVACDWYDQDLGPVFYRERGEGTTFESTALLEAILRQTDGQTLVVVEDAIRDDANAIFEVMQAVEADPTISFLLDARTQEWRSPDTAELDSRREAFRRTTIETQVVPRFDERECRRFIDHFTTLVDTDLDITGPELFDHLDPPHTHSTDEVATGDALLIQHHLARLHDPPITGEATIPTALEDAVQQTYQYLTTLENPIVVDLATLIAALTAAGIPVAPDYLYSLTDPHEFDAIDAAITHLEGNLIFTATPANGGASTAYRTRHETWATTFLEHLRTTETMHAARNRFGTPLTQLLALADDPHRRETIQSHLGGRTPHLHRIAADPTGWADELTERLFTIGLTNASLAPLYGTTEDTIHLPDACSPWVHVLQAYWRGEMNRTHGDLARAEREYRTVTDRLANNELTQEPPTHANPVTVSPDSTTDDPDTRRHRWQATTQTRLGTIARERGDYDTAHTHYTTARDRFQAINDRGGVATTLKNLGIIAFYQSDFPTARDYYNQSLEIADAIDAKRIQVDCLNNLAGVAWKQGNYDDARTALEDSLAISRDLGDQEAEYSILNNLGDLAQAQDDYDGARTYYTDALTIFRDLGDRPSEATILTNLGQVAIREGDYSQAGDALQRALELKRDLGDRKGEIQTLRDLSTIALAQGAYDQARENITQSIDLAQELDDSQSYAAATNKLGEIHLAQHNQDQAATHFQESHEIATELEARSTVADSALNHARLAVRRGDTDTATYHLATAEKIYDTVGSDLGIGRCAIVNARLALIQQDIATAHDHATTAKTIFDRIGATHWLGRSHRILGDIAIARADTETAIDNWETAVTIFESVDTPPDTLTTLQSLVDAGIDIGDRDHARDWWERADTILKTAPPPTVEQHRDWIDATRNTVHTD